MSRRWQRQSLIQSQQKGKALLKEWKVEKEKTEFDPKPAKRAKKKKGNLKKKKQKKNCKKKKKKGKKEQKSKTLPFFVFFFV